MRKVKPTIARRSPGDVATDLAGLIEAKAKQHPGGLAPLDLDLLRQAADLLNRTQALVDQVAPGRTRRTRRGLAEQLGEVALVLDQADRIGRKAVGISGQVANGLAIRCQAGAEVVGDLAELHAMAGDVPRQTLQVIYTWPDGREEMRYSAPVGSQRAAELQAEVDALRLRVGDDCLYSTRVVEG